MWLLHSVNSSSLSSPSPEHIQYTVYGLSWMVYLDQPEEISSVFYLCLSSLGVYSKLLCEKLKVSTCEQNFHVSCCTVGNSNLKTIWSLGIHSSFLPLLPSRLFQHGFFSDSFSQPFTLMSIVQVSSLGLLFFSICPLAIFFKAFCFCHQGNVSDSQL